jgi:hypothetical protein
VIVAPEQLAALTRVATRLAELNDEVVFVGGMIRGLLMSDAAASSPRPTNDVDLIIEIGLGDYHRRVQPRLRELGFREDTTKNAPLCRWLVDEITVDVMPSTDDVLGFSNPWYPHALKTSTTLTLDESAASPVCIRVISAPAFCATKLVAYRSRGANDPYHSDMEDFLAVVDGRPELVAELQAADAELAAFVASQVRLLFRERIEDVLAHHIEGPLAVKQRRSALLLQTLREIAQLGSP